MKNDTLLSVRDLSVQYATYFGTVAAVRGVSLDLGANESIGIIGESGSGKSTLAYAVMDYLAGNGRSEGEIRFKGEDLLTKSRREMQRYRGNRLAMVYQNPYSSLNPALTIGFQLDEVTMRHRGLSRRDAREASLGILDDLYLGDAAGLVRRYPHQISGGMQQRVCIAMALLCQPDLIILDEPTTALDVTTEAVILDLIRDLQKRYSMSLMYISHDIGVINEVSDRIAVMYRGEIVETGPTEEIYRNPKHPYTRALINCIPRPGLVKEEHRLNAIPGYVRRRSLEETGCPFADRCAKRAPGCLERYGMEEVGFNHFAACDRAYATGTSDDGVGIGENPIPRVAEGTELLRIEDLYKIYGRRNKPVRALDGVTLAVKSHNVLGVVGESGCGKSTMGLTVSGLLTPTTGRVLFDGEDISISWRERSVETLKQIQLIFQNPGRSLNPSFTIERVIGRPLRRLLGISSRAERRQRIVEMLAKVGLGEEYLYRKATQLSGGEMQRAAIARAFSLSPRLVVCDEPTSALDVSVQSSVLNLLSDLQHASGVSYIFISHDLNVIGYVSDYIVVMYLGRMCEYGRRDEVMNPPFHPYTEALLSAVPEIDPSRSRKQIRLEGSPPDPTAEIVGCPFAGRCPRKLGEICDSTPPPRVELSDSHFLYCHIPADELRVNATVGDDATPASSPSLD